MTMFRWFCVALLAVTCSVADAADWPTLRGNVQRSGIADEPLELASLNQAWVWRSDAPPQTAWGRPAKWDAYARVRGLPSMRSYDLVFHLTTVGDQLFFGSSTDDSVHALDVLKCEDFINHGLLMTRLLVPAWPNFMVKPTNARGDQKDDISDDNGTLCTVLSSYCPPVKKKRHDFFAGC